MIKRFLRRIKLRLHIFHFTSMSLMLKEDYEKGECEERPYRFISKLYAFKIIKLKRELKQLK